MKKNLVNIILVIIALGLSVISWLLLPDVVVVQVGIDGHFLNYWFGKI